jgi:hypothetical protein
MTQISLTSGEILYVINSIRAKERSVRELHPHMSVHYLNIAQQFEDVYNKLQELPGEERVANLILAAS